MHLCYVMCKNMREAKKIGHDLLEKKLAICINIFPKVISAYWWEGKIEEAEEILLCFKSKKSLFKKINTAVRNLHSYEVVALVAFSIDQMDPKYKNFVSKNFMPAVHHES